MYLMLAVAAEPSSKYNMQLCSTMQARNKRERKIKEIYFKVDGEIPNNKSQRKLANLAVYQYQLLQPALNIISSLY